jgi:hypothetical protein
MIIGSLVTNELHLCNLISRLMTYGGTGQMDQMSTGARASDSELDEALARAIRQLIAEAVQSGDSGTASAAA